MPLSRVQSAHYDTLLAEKVKRVTELLTPYSPPEPEVYPSSPTGFRLRAEFRMWHEGDDIHYVMFRRDEPQVPVFISDFPIADSRIQKLMPLLREKVQQNAALRHKLFQIEFLSSMTGDLLVTLIYHRKLDQAWENAAHALVNALHPVAPRLSVIGRSRRQQLIIGKDFIEEVLSIQGNDYRYRQYEQAFSQPNGQVNIRMIEWACERAAALSGDLLELYCGNGNFTLPLSRHFNNVIATEVSKTSIRAARENLLENSIDNVQVVRLSAQEATQAINAERIFRRLGTLPKSLDQFNLTTLFVDPPRAGLDEHTVIMASHFPTIFYISCNPQTLAQNLGELSRSHAIKHFALFDQFPYTDHMECGVVLQRR